jgi:hypothetical protein
MIKEMIEARQLSIRSCKRLKAQDELLDKETKYWDESIAGYEKEIATLEGKLAALPAEEPCLDA